VSLFRKEASMVSGRPLFSICHTTARPEGWQKAYREWIEKAAHPEQVEYVLCVDERWGFNLGSTFGSPFEDRAGSPLNKLVWNEGRKCYVDGVNTACAAATGRILIVNADDQLPCERWDEALYNYCLQFGRDLWRDNSAFAIQVSTGTPNEVERGIMPMPILSRGLYKQWGYALYPKYEGVFSDNDTFEHAKHDGVIVPALPLMFPHRHPLFEGKKPEDLDEAWKHHNKTSDYQYGQAVLARRRAAKFGEVEAPGALEGRAPISVCLPGEVFSSQWVCAWTELLSHMTNRGFVIGGNFGHSSNVFITRSFLAKNALAMKPKPKFLLWIDDDQPVTPAAFDQLLSDLDNTDADMVAGWTWIPDPNKMRISAGKMDEGKDEVLHIPPGEMVKATEQGAVIEVEWTGFPVVLMRTEALEKAGRLPFMPMEAPRSEWGHAGEDVSFCTRLRNAGGKILVDSRVFVPHLKLLPFIPVQAMDSAEKVPLSEAVTV